MNVRKVTNGYLLRLAKDELLIESLINFAKQHSVASAWIQGLGAVQWAEMGYYHLEQKEYGWRKVQETMEIVSAQGNISIVEGEPFIHLHGALSGEDFKTLSGHIKEAQIGGTGEFFITTFEEPMTRTHDEVVGLKLLDL